MPGAMKARQVKPGDKQCEYCGHWNGEHDNACPKTPEDLEVWKAGYQASQDGDNCYAEVGSTYWLGWITEGFRRVASERTGQEADQGGPGPARPPDRE